jgi:thioredoxin reductase (NADPH)
MLQDLPMFTGEQRLQDVLFSRPNVRTLTEVAIDRLITENGELKGLGIHSRTENSAESQEIACDGLFVAIGLIPENAPFADLAALNAYGYFDADETCRTATPGVFAAGDCRSKRVRQLTTAVADGASAAIAACNYIDAL